MLVEIPLTVAQLAALAAGQSIEITVEITAPIPQPSPNPLGAQPDSFFIWPLGPQKAQ